MSASPATATCPACGVEVALGDRFCEECGYGLETPSPTPPAVVCLKCGEQIPAPSTGYCSVCGVRQPAPGDREEAVDRDVAAVTDRGRRRPGNQDAFAVSSTPGGRVVAVVCDGVSTTISPDQASRRAADAAVTALRRDADHRSSGEALAEAFDAAREAVNGVEWSPQGEIGPPSCTFLAAVAHGDRIEVASMGDCRAFWIPDAGEAENLTRDDSWASDQVLAGTMTSEAAHADPRSHSITRWLGSDADPTWRPQGVAFTATHPGRLVLCSDGLWNYAGSAAEVASLAGSGEPLSVARRLVDHANDRGGQDNITVVVVDIPCSPDTDGAGSTPERTAR